VNPSTVNPPAEDETKMEKKGEIVCYKPRSLKHRGITRELEYLLKLYSRELISTIDRYKKWQNAFIYSK